MNFRATLPLADCYLLSEVVTNRSIRRARNVQILTMTTLHYEIVDRGSIFKRIVHSMPVGLWMRVATGTDPNRIQSIADAIYTIIEIRNAFDPS